MKFNLDGRVYESDVQQVVAAAIIRSGPHAGEPKGLKEPKYTIVEGGKGWQVKLTMFGGRRQHLKTCKTLGAAIKYATKYEDENKR